MNRDGSEGYFKDDRFEMYSKRSEIKTKVIIYGVISTFVFFLLLPWCVGLVEVARWIFF